MKLKLSSIGLAVLLLSPVALGFQAARSVSRPSPEIEAQYTYDGGIVELRVKYVFPDQVFWEVWRDGHPDGPCHKARGSVTRIYLPNDLPARVVVRTKRADLEVVIVRRGSAITVKQTGA